MDLNAKLGSKWSRARANLGMVAVFSAVNVALDLFDAGFYFPFSASFPDMAAGFAEAARFGGMPALAFFFLLTAVGCIGFYGLCWWLSQKRPVMMLVALAGFLIDCLALLYVAMFWGVMDASVVIGAAFHVWVLYYLITGVRAWLAARREDPYHGPDDGSGDGSDDDGGHGDGI